MIKGSEEAGNALDRLAEEFNKPRRIVLDEIIFETDAVFQLRNRKKGV